MRLFIAIQLPETIVDCLLETISDWKDHGVTGTWTKPVNFHITAAFLGEQPESSLPVIKKILQEVPFFVMDLKIAAVGNFKDLYYAQITDLQNNPYKLLTDYVYQLCKALQEAGFVLDQRFKAHVTMARRLKNPDHYQLAVQVQTFHVDQVCLYQSVLSPQGPAYTILDRFPDAAKISK